MGLCLLFQGCIRKHHPNAPGYHFILVHRMLNKDKMIPGYTRVMFPNAAQEWNRETFPFPLHSRITLREDCFK